MERSGKFFEFGYPNFYGGIEYNWPNKQIDYNNLLRERRADLGDILIENLKRYYGKYYINLTKQFTRC